MPGIVGLLTSRSRQQAERELLRMVHALHHEPFEDTGTWVDERLGVYVGWVVRKDSSAEYLPIRCRPGTIALFFSGEEFSDLGLARRLLDVSDDSFLERLNGTFHGLLTDEARGTATLFNDRYGVHRLYYHEAGDAFYFAAEAKAILALRPELRRIDSRGMGELVACGCVLENRTLFPGIHVLPGAAAWVFRRGSVEAKRTYFHAREWEEQSPLPPEPYYREVRDVFRRNLPRYFQAQEPIGMSLTGGLDTRTIMASHKPPAGSLPCYTFGGMFRDSRDVVVARRVAHECGQSHEVIRVGKDFLSRFPEYAERTVYLTDGCADVSRSPDLYANERARKIAPIRMTGNYGGEILRRIRAFRPVELLPGLFRQDFVSYLRRAKETYAGLLKAHPLSFAVFKQAPWYQHGVRALEQTQLSLRSPYLDNELVRTVFRAPESAVTSDHIYLRLIADANPTLRRIWTDRGPIDGSPTNLSALAGRGVLGFLNKAEYAYDYVMPQWLARIDHVLAPFRMERLFLGRNRFFHFRVSFRDALSEYVRDVLLDRRTRSRPYLEPHALEAVVRGHLKGDRNYTTEIEKLLTLELIHRLFIDAS